MTARKKKQKPARRRRVDVLDLGTARPYPVRFPNGVIHEVMQLDAEGWQLAHRVAESRTLEDGAALFRRCVPTATEQERASLGMAQMAAVLWLAQGRPESARLALEGPPDPLPLTLGALRSTKGQVM